MQVPTVAPCADTVWAATLRSGRRVAQRTPLWTAANVGESGSDLVNARFTTYSWKVSVAISAMQDPRLARDGDGPSAANCISSASSRLGDVAPSFLPTCRSRRLPDCSTLAAVTAARCRSDRPSPRVARH